jgi:predicted acetyltransferase
MTPKREFGTISNSQEAQQLGQILSQCFNFPISLSQQYFDRLGLENFRFIRQGNQILGGLAIYWMGQWFGGQSIPMAGLAAVGIAPENRGSGVAAELLTQTLQQFYADGVPLSALYASTSALYRKVGYEQAGNSCIFSVPTRSIKLSQPLPSNRSLPVQRVELTDLKIFHDLYRQQAKANNGNLDRNSVIWERIVKPPEDEVVHAYLIGLDSQPEGYVIFHQTQGERGYNLRVLDWVTLTPTAARRLWTFFADHRSLAEEVRWKDAVVNPFVSLLAEQSYRIKHLERWLVRIVNVAKALSLRGYPAGVEAELHLEVQDNLLPENNGKFVLTVSQGRGEVTKGGRGELQLDIRGLTPLFTSLLTPQQLQVIGEVTATDNALASASQIFAGSEPWMSDHF